MSYIDWMLLPYRRYADFSGRSQRIEYWMFTLFTLLLFGALALLGSLVGAFDESGRGVVGTLVVILMVVLLLATLVPSIAVIVRRFHDQDKSGWFYLLSFVPYIGGIIIFAFMCVDGTVGSNRFGPSPKDNGADTFN